MDAHNNHSNTTTHNAGGSSRTLQASPSSSPIQKIEKNCMGTLELTMKFAGMRKAQEFTVYPIKGDDQAQIITIQSDTRIGEINLGTGWVRMSKPHASGAYFHHLIECTNIVKLEADALLMLKAELFATADKKAGTNGVMHCDNSGAARVFEGA